MIVVRYKIINVHFIKMFNLINFIVNIKYAYKIKIATNRHGSNKIKNGNKLILFICPLFYF